MRAVDTNVLARYYLSDDPEQSSAATRLLSGGDVFVPKTVVLELEWVLRSVAERPGRNVLDCLEHLAALPGTVIEDQQQVEQAIVWSRNGLDFADALHLAASHSCAELFTFDDRGYARKAARHGLAPPVRLLEK